MGDRPSANPDPGWYADPAGSGEQRYWDGSAWTAETRAPTTSASSRPPAPTRRRWLIAGAITSALVVAAGAGLVLSGQLSDDVQTPLSSADAGAAADAAADAGTAGETATETTELPPSLQLLGAVDRPTGRDDLVMFTDIAALRAADILPAPASDGDGWSTALDAENIGAMPLLAPYMSPVGLRRPLPMDRAVGLPHDEVAVSLGTYGDGNWFIPARGLDVVEERLRASPVWTETGPDGFERVGDFTVESIGGYEPDAIEQRILASIPRRAELTGGALRLDDGALTRRGDPLGAQPAWAAIIDRLAVESAVSSVLMPHEELSGLPDGGTPLQPAAAMAMAAVIDGDGLSDLLVLEHEDADRARANAEGARTNLTLLMQAGPYDGEVTVDGTTVLVRVRQTDEAAGTSALFPTMRRLPTGPLNLIIGSLPASDADVDAASSSGQAPGDAPLDGASITVASKDFDEQLILGALSVALLEDAGAVVDDRGSLGGTDAARAALRSGEIDHYWEYTGTAAILFHDTTDPVTDRAAQYEAVREREAEEYGLYWLEPTRFNNTYAIALSRQTDRQLGGIDTISEMAALLRRSNDALTLCVESEFNVRSDGLPGLETHYGVAIPDDSVRVLDVGAIYAAVADAAPCTFGEVFRTDGRIAALDLKVLEDDRSFFPVYDAAPVFDATTWAAHGQALQQLYAPVARALDDDTMRQLNARVSQGNERPEDIATDWLIVNGFIR